LARRLPLTALAALAAWPLLAALACDRASSTSARREAAADSAARAALPPVLAEALALDAYLNDAYLSATPRAECVLQSEPGQADERRRVRAPLPDSSVVIAYVRASASDAELRRVEMLRRAPDGEQLGVTWSGEENQTSVVRWPNGLRQPAERAVHPRGGPLPRVMRALGRRVLTLRCGRGERGAREVTTTVDAVR
jgi:hypothetical protein